MLYVLYRCLVPMETRSLTWEGLCWHSLVWSTLTSLEMPLNHYRGWTTSNSWKLSTCIPNPIILDIWLKFNDLPLLYLSSHAYWCWSVTLILCLHVQWNLHNTDTTGTLPDCSYYSSEVVQVHPSISGAHLHYWNYSDSKRRPKQGLVESDVSIFDVLVW